MSFLLPIAPGLSAAKFVSTAEALMESEKSKLAREEIAEIAAISSCQT